MTLRRDAAGRQFLTAGSMPRRLAMSGLLTPRRMGEAAMFLMSPRFFALPLAAVLIIYALPRERTVSLLRRFRRRTTWW